MEFRIQNTAELGQVAAAFLKAYPTPAVVAVHGEMGAGKTTFIRSLVQQLGGGEASSPTFALVNEYALTGKPSVYHLDLYRLRDLREALDMGITEYLDSKGYVFIEWPDIIHPLLDEQTIHIYITEDAGERLIRF